MEPRKMRSALRLNERQKRILEQYVACRRATVGQCVRINILLETWAGSGRVAIAQHLDINPKVVSLWRKRWIASYAALSTFEAGQNGKGVSDGELLAKMLEVLTDQARAGKPASISTAQKQQIVALACEKPEDYGLPFTHWTQERLAEASIQRGIVDQISPRYVGVLLKNQRAATA